LLQIIPKKAIAVESYWQKELASAFSDPAKLLTFLGFNPQDFAPDIAARRLFAMRVPRPFAARMAKQDINDPLFRQVFPLREEFAQAPGYSLDPLQEQQNNQPGVLHKYQSRVLLLVRGGCAVNCRYCFRRHFPYGDNHLNKQDWLETLDYIRSDENINEVIYSGGDPLMAKDDFLAWLTDEIEKIPHIKRIRIHTRLPVVIPGRITPELIQWFCHSRLKPIMVLHINHAQEIDGAVANAIQKLSQAGVTMLNQSVILKDVNDSGDTQVALSERLFEVGVLPYYLHMLDKVQGAQHFDRDEAAARDIMAQMIKRLPGFLVPKLVREIGGQPGKTPIDLKLHP
jgi:EF-P beta-lysylation protein EpmB